MSGNKASRVDFDRIEVGEIENCRETLRNIPALAADLRERGLLNPLIVWHRRMSGNKPHPLPDGTKVFDRYTLIGGHRRHAAIALIREDDPKAFEQVPVTLVTGNLDDAMFAQIADNLQREDLSPLDLANAVYRLSKREHTQSVIAKRLSISQPTVSKLLKVRECCVEEVLRAVAKGDVTLDTALDLAALDQAEQLTALAEHGATAATEGRAAAKRAVRHAAGKKTRPSTSEIRERFAKAEESTAKNAKLIRRVLAWVLGEGAAP